MERKRNIKLSFILISGMLVLGLWGCVRESIQHTTSDTLNITQYINKYPDKFSLLSKVLNISETASFLKAYGSYTMFAPTDDAIRAYLKTLNKSAVEDVTPAAWKDFVRFHLLADSVPTSRFTDGKLPTLTMYGQYLITQATNTNGITQIVVNRQANIVTANISVGNGIIHIVDHVLIPTQLTIAQTLDANPEYSWFTQALRETTLFDSLNIIPANNPDDTRKFLTVIAETNDVIKAAGYLTYTAFRNHYSNTNVPKTPTDSLHLFMDYHILYGAKYLADIIVNSAHTTLAPAQVVTAKLYGTTVLINDDDYNGVHEPGVALRREFSDVTATNGVINDASGHYGIKVRNPFPVFFDVQAVPDVMKNTAVYKKPGTYVYTSAEALTFTADIRFASNVSNFSYLGSASTQGKTAYNGDIFTTPFGISSRPIWVEFRTPLIVRGTYKIWLGYYTQSQSTNTGVEAVPSIGIETSPDRFPLSNSRTVNFNTRRPGLTKTVNGVSVPDGDGEEAIGFKQYMASTDTRVAARLMGVVNITQTGRYWFRLTAINQSQNTNNIDMIQFIPVTMDQQYPRFNPDGSLIPRP